MLLAAIVLQASAVAFSPPLDVPLRVASERREDTRAYRLERQLRFVREGEGYRADVVLRAATGDTPDSSGTLYEAGYAALIGTPIRLHLDRAGAVTAVDDLPALWERFCARVAEVAAARRVLAPADRARLAARIAMPLRALPAERQRAMFASLVSVAIADEDLTPGSRPVTLPASSAFGSATPLDGTRTVTPLPGGLVRSTTRAASATVTLERVLDIDPGTGLVMRNSKTVTVRAGALEKASVTLITVGPGD
ncbi:hypothetical protein [Sphingomonas sp. KR3-1]|uniref:hypothetical protein n=1 Tax=Sphingomonas sp. KR3-1 TaxID=3156611 RepID=UPI0032B6182E